MVIFMTNIPRRKIYETMLEYEDGLIEMQILTFSEENFKKYSKKFNQEKFNQIKKAYIETKALLVMFLENNKYETNEDFDKKLHELITNNSKVNDYLEKSKSLNQHFKKIINIMDNKIMPMKGVSSVEETNKTYEDLINFNDHIPKILEIRRNEMKLK